MSNINKDIQLRQSHTQLCVWLAIGVQNAEKPISIKEFEDFMMDELNYRVQYIYEYATRADNSGEGGRNDVVFALHKDDVMRMIGDRFIRFNGDIKWYDDYKANYGQQIPPEYYIMGEFNLPEMSGS
tara:strand:+ start:33822 stop:34202 length:381 start_codon:yes stop_codon:yes gene_type:complete